MEFVFNLVDPNLVCAKAAVVMSVGAGLLEFVPPTGAGGGGGRGTAPLGTADTEDEPSRCGGEPLPPPLP